MDNDRPAGLVRVVSAFAVAALFALPLVWALATSLKPSGEYVSASAALLPREFTLMHYEALADSRVWRLALNSLAVTLGTTALALAAALPAAYALARFDFPHRLDALFLAFVLLVKLTPPIVLAVPLYQVLRTLGLLDTLAGLVLVNQIYAMPFALWMLLGFVRDVPFVYEEAAAIDGAGLARRIVQIVIPILGPGLAATGVLVAIAAWNEFLFAFLFLQSPANFTLPTYVATRINEDETLWGQLSAIGVLASLPILALIGFVHRALSRGFAGGLN
ncbi:MAG: carbohydrate ABC transporter permease [Magnetospirillum sp.]|nr:carbohydrate ABC transporter permease [Magnetospirillum sp.]